MSLKEEITNLFAEEDGNEVEREFFHSEFTESTKWDGEFVKAFKTKLEDNDIQFKHEDNFGGEGCGDDYWSVYSFTRGNEKVFVQFDGWYQSYNGSEYNKWFFVEPKEVVVTRYFKSK